MKKGSKNKNKLKNQEIDNDNSPSYDDIVNELTNLQVKYEEISTKRNYIQQERDMLEKNCKNAGYKINELNQERMLKANKLQEIEENHKIELRTYLQKIKQLEFENEKDTFNLELQETADIHEENKRHRDLINELKVEKNELKKEIEKKQGQYLVETDDNIKNNQVVLTHAKSRFIEQLKEYEVKNQERLKELEHELELKIKTELNEIEERKNFHINELIINHEKAYEELKSFYNYITVQNLALIRSQKEEKEKSFNRHEVNQKKIDSLKEKNRELEVS